MIRSTLIFAILVSILPPVVFTQVYPGWFLDQGSLGCANLVVGLADPAFHPDSSVSDAIRRSYETYARQACSRITGKEEAWATERGNMLALSIFTEDFDSASAIRARGLLVPLDTLITKSMTLVLLGPRSCLLTEHSRQRIPVVSMPGPPWVYTTPTDERYHYATGSSEMFFYETSSWRLAEERARIALARSGYVDLHDVIMKSNVEGIEINEQSIAVVVRDIEIIARWRDLKDNVVHVLARAPKQQGN
jgi:hypothetical protein